MQKPRILIGYRENDDTVSLQRDQFETLFERVEDAHGGFDLDRLPPDAEPHATILSFHPQFETVLSTLERAGIDRERVTSVDADKVDDALEVTELSESDVYEIEESEYVRKTEVGEEQNETRLQGRKDRLAATDEDTEELQQEIEELEQRIENLTSFDSGSSFHTKARDRS